MPSTVELTTPDGVMDLYDAEPSGEPRGGVIVFQEAFGVNDHIEDVCRRFAAEGYRSVAPHLFHRSGDPVLDYSNIDKVMPHIQELSQDRMLTDIDATLGHLSSVGLSRSQVGAVGFCMGGTVTFLAAAHHALGAAVTFYGGGLVEGRFGMPSLVDLVPQLKTPWLGLFGDLDQGIPVDQVEALREAIKSAPVPAEIVRYAEAGHGFHCDARSSYHEASAADAWARTLDWFNQHIGRS